MIETNQTGTFWIDDATLTNSSGQPVTESFPPVNFKSLRLWDAQTTWLLLEPQKGQWDFTILDRFVNEAVARNQNITPVLGQSPTWASARPGDVSYNGKGAPAEPRDIQDWRNYVSTVATRYRGKIKFYEIWNEPNDRTFYTGSIPKMVELTNEAAAVLKRVDPTITVISPPPYVESRLTDFFAAAANAFGVIEQWLIGATVRNFTNVDNNWRVELTLANGTRGWIIWNPTSTVNYTIPADWNVQTKRDLYGVSTNIAGSTGVSINAVPILIESAPAVNTFTDGVYKITALHSGKALDVRGFSTANDAIVHQWKYFGQTNQ